jgi:hypothetical protein
MWLPSNETAVDIGCYVHCTVCDLIATTRQRRLEGNGRDQRKHICKYDLRNDTVMCGLHAIEMFCHEAYCTCAWYASTKCFVTLYICWRLPHHQCNNSYRTLKITNMSREGREC